MDQTTTSDGSAALVCLKARAQPKDGDQRSHGRFRYSQVRTSPRSTLAYASSLRPVCFRWHARRERFAPVRGYNEDDIALCNWLEERRAELMAAGTPVPRAQDVEDGAPNENVAAWLACIEPVMAQLLRDVPDDPVGQSCRCHHCPAMAQSGPRVSQSTVDAQIDAND